jgi:hypothetical protein
MSVRSSLGRGFTALIVLLLAAASGGLIAFSPDIALPLAVLMSPGLFALMIDRAQGLGVARAILLFQGAACVQPIMGAWYQCAGMNGCMDYLAGWPTVLKVWLAAAAAWVMTETLPLVIKVLDDYRLRNRRALLVERRAALMDEWGLGSDSNP